jgi:hypothetical protein
MAVSDGFGGVDGIDGIDGIGDGLGDAAEAGGAGASLTDAHRDEAIERLKRHAAPGGVLSSEALADRVRRVYLAQTRAGVDQVLADLPRDPPWSMPVGLPPVPGEELARRPPRPLPDRRRTLVLVLGGVALVLGVGGAAVAFAPTDDSEAEPGEQAAEPADDRLPASTLPQLAVPEAPATTATTVPTTLPPVPDADDLAGLGGIPGLDLTYELRKVGVDIEPGRYLSTGTATCYWERVKSFGGTLDDIIVNGAPSGDHVIVDVAASDAGLRTQGCDFRPYAPPAAPATSFGDGDWLVGSDIAPGTYRLTEKTSTFTGDASLCRWERAADFAHDFFDTIASDYPAGADVTVDLRPDERFTSDLCGTWTHL